MLLLPPPFALVLGAFVQAPEPSADDLEFFEQRVRPVLEERCLSCHASTLAKPKGGLVLDSRQGWERGASLGAAVVPGEPDASPLVRAVRYDEFDLQMPPKGRLPDAEVDALVEWVRRGAPDPRDGDAPVAARTVPKPEEHWALRALTDPTPPTVRDERWVRNGVDRFVLARLESEGLAPAPFATKRELLERVHFDLVGLPPTSEALAEFERDPEPDAYERVVDRLLASPHYGERWGRYWLDLARYADSNGLDENLALGEAWRYRDYVVRAFNQDKPYDRFVTEQLAGDLLPEPEDRDALADQIAATGFLVLGPKMLAEQDKQKLVMDIVDEQMDVAGKAFLGLTLGCARCHDHKFDPISARDYYAVAGVFKSTSTMANLDFVSRWRERELASAADRETAAAHRKASEQAKAELDALVAENDRALQDGWRRDFAPYLLAGTFAAKRATLIEAEEFSRGNLAVDRETWGDAEVAIVHTRASGEQFVEYDVTLESAKRLVLDVRYASAEERPMRVLLNGAVVAETALGAKTGSFLLDGQRWTRVGAFDFQPGRNVLRLDNQADVPHLDKFVLAPAGAGDAAADGEREWYVDGNPWADGLVPELVRNFAVHVELSARRGDPVFAPWHAFAALGEGEWARRASEVVARLRGERPEALAVPPTRLAPPATPLAEVDAGFQATPDEAQAGASSSPPLPPRVLALLDGLPPRSLEELAGRYQTLFSAIEADWREARARDGEKPTALASADAEALRQVLHGKHGPFALTTERLESFFPEPARAELAMRRAKVEQLAASAPKPFDRALGVQDGEIVDVPVHLRGSHLSLEKDAVPRGVLSATAHVLDAPAMPSDRSGRLEFARWLVDPRHPLTWRVIANRVWAGHFGRGLVASTSNFGVRGELPTHPELLDWLAQELQRRHGSLKSLHRLIVTSSAYRMSTRGNAVASERDPENRLLARQNRRRLEAEVMRDAWLAASGRLDATLGGKSMTTASGEYVTNDQSTDQARYQSTRRSLYLPIIRNAMYGFFSAFDYNDPSTPIDVRPETVAAPQALFLMNSDEVVESARALAELALAAEPEREGERIAWLWRRTLCREPSERERQAAIDFVNELKNRDAAQPTAGGGDEHAAANGVEHEVDASHAAEPVAAPTAAARERGVDGSPLAMGADAAKSVATSADVPWIGLAHVLLVSNEFLYVD
ncbi:MAG: DUF1553 domain-containing protein [Planctomycetes bacterium]|nr:DUF1553 domain-containing protein [Planctomycetota bacterium]